MSDKTKPQAQPRPQPDTKPQPETAKQAVQQSMDRRW
jgi:hypothetical protein